MSPAPLTWALVAAAVLCNAVAQILIKRAAVTDALNLQSWLSVPLLSAVASYGLSFALTALVFARFPLSLISPMMAGAIFVVISVFSVAFLGEALGPARIAGMVCVVVGIALLARSA